MLLIQLNLQAAGGGGSAETQIQRTMTRPQETRAADFVGYGAIVVTSALLLSATPPPAAAEYQFGTHELAIKEAQSKGRIWGQTPPTAVIAGQPFGHIKVAREQDAIQIAARIAKQFFDEPQKHPIWVAAPQVNLEQLQPQIFGQQPASVVVVDSPPNRPTVLAGQQSEPDRQQAQIYRQKLTSVVAPDSPLNRPTALAGQQGEPDRLQANVFRQEPAGLIQEVIIDRVTTRPQDDPTQTAAQIFKQPPPTSVAPTDPPRNWRSIFAGQQDEPDRIQPQFKKRQPPNTAAQNPPRRPRFFNAQQNDPTQIAARVWGQTPATAMKTVSAAKYQFGTHELAVRESQSKGWITHGIIPSAVTQVVLTPTFFAGQQAEPERQQARFDHQKTASAVVQAPPNRPAFFAGQQVEGDRLKASVFHQTPPSITYATVSTRIFVRPQPQENPQQGWLTQLGPPEPLGLEPFIFAGQQAEPERQQALFVGTQPPSHVDENPPVGKRTLFSGQQGEPERQQAWIGKQAPANTAPTATPLKPTWVARQQDDPSQIPAQIFKQAPQRLEIGRRAIFAGQQGEPDRQQALFIKQPPVSIAPDIPPLTPTFFAGQQFEKDRPSLMWTSAIISDFVLSETVFNIVEVIARFQVADLENAHFTQTLAKEIRFALIRTEDVKF